MVEVFWSLEDDEGNAPSNSPETPPTMSSSSPQHSGHTIHGSPFWLVSSLAIVGVMVVTPTDWGWWLPLIALAMLAYGFFEYAKTVIVSWDEKQRYVEVSEGSRYSEARELMLAYTSEPGDTITIKSKPASGNPLDFLSARDYWLVVKRTDGTLVASSEGYENSRSFAKRIKDCLDQFQ
jgi:hypothetical protein